MVWTFNALFANEGIIFNIVITYEDNSGTELISIVLPNLYKDQFMYYVYFCNNSLWLRFPLYTIQFLKVVLFYSLFQIENIVMKFLNFLPCRFQ